MTKIKNYVKYHYGNLILRLKILFYGLFGNKSERKLFVIGVAEHGNYGDFAISEAQNKFLKDHFKEKIIEITEEEISNPLTIRLIESMIGTDDIIFLQGGGNHGNIYLFHEHYRREIINKFHKNRIVLFPQTYYFTDNEEGQRQAQISKECFSAHPDLILAFRDMFSFKLAQKAYPENTVLFCPDIVLYLNGCFEKRSEDPGSIMILFRAGKEAKYQPAEKKSTIELLEKKYTLRFNNHTATQKITSKNRYTLIKNQSELYAQSDVVLTDKLHGAIFSIITSTPCVMLNTFNHKIKEFYKIFENVEGYYFAEKLEDIPALVDKAFQVKKCTNPDLNKYYENLFNEISK